MFTLAAKGISVFPLSESFVEDGEITCACISACTNESPPLHPSLVLTRALKS